MYLLLGSTVIFQTVRSWHTAAIQIGLRHEMCAIHQF